MPQDQLDWTEIRAGTIPWTPEGFIATHEAHTRLLRTPHDDWDRGPAPRALPAESEVELRIPRLFALDAIECQIGRYLSRAHLLTPLPVLLSHLKRYFTIMDFLNAHHQELKSDGLVVTRRSGELWFSSVLIEVVTFVRYEDRSISRIGEELHTFNFGRVVRVAKHILANPEGDLA